jgi:hypothetical protein
LLDEEQAIKIMLSFSKVSALSISIDDKGIFYKEIDRMESFGFEKVAEDLYVVSFVVI